jgi:hypothetical protein
MKDTFELYQVLGLEPGASAKRIRNAYLELAHTWDPQKHLHNPILMAETEKKRKEIDDAYQAISFFLPELQRSIDDTEDSRRISRDFKEMVIEPTAERTRTMMGVLVAIVFLMIFGWAYYLLMKGHSVTPSATATLE